MATTQTSATGSGEIECHLYSYNYSLCSLMTRYMLAVRGPPGPGFPTLKITDTEIDIHHAFDQLDEWYLRDVSSQGQVPALSLSTSPPTLLTDSLDIAEYFLHRYPALQAPAEQEATQSKLLTELHQLDYFAICFTATGAPVSANPRLQAVEKTRERLGRERVSEGYRRVLEHKLEVLTTQLSSATSPTHAADSMAQAHAFFAHVEAVMALNTEAGPWIWGRHGPTALDTHVIAFLARLEDVRHGKFFTERMRAYYEGAVGTEDWKGVMGGRGTMG